MTIQNLYTQYLDGKITQSKFLYEVLQSFFNTLLILNSLLSSISHGSTIISPFDTLTSHLLPVISSTSANLFITQYPSGPTVIALSPEEEFTVKALLVLEVKPEPINVLLNDIRPC